MFAVLSVHAQTVINLTGKITNQDGKPVKGAIVVLVKQGLKDTSETDGTYKVQSNASAVLPLLQPKNRTIFIDRGYLQFSLPEPAPVSVALFDITGNLLKKEQTTTTSTGFYRFNIEKDVGAVRLLVVRATIGSDCVTFRYLSLGNGKFVVNNATVNNVKADDNRFAKVEAIDDTIKVTASGYTPALKAITNYEQAVNIALDTLKAGSPTRSAGCGKTTTLKGETRLKVNVGGKDREYIIRLPDDYDANNPYKLWFTIHPLGGTAEMVANAKNYEYYGMWKYANPKDGKGTTIFCSPHGTPYSGSSLGWANSSGSDVEFIRTLLQKFKEELCIDTTHIFSEGFSMGGSMSYALACAMPTTFRAICMHSGGPMSGCDQTKRGPVAMFITHGTNDKVCTYPTMGGVPQIKDFAQRNSCTAIDIPNVLKPTDSSGKIPACADFQNCDPRYPCKACIFVGDHEYMPGGGATGTWVDDSTWNFFKQF